MADGSKTESDYDVLYRIMSTRMSVRRLRPDPIPDEYVDKILEAGRWAMSGANGQPWEYLVIKDPKKKKALYDAFQDTNQEFCFWMEQMRPFELRHPAFQVKGNDLIFHLVLELAWALAFMVLARLLYKLGLKRYSAYGG